jgi:hypothetical protein
VAEGARLESVYTGNRIEGSNPSLSASSFIFLYFHDVHTTIHTVLCCLKAGMALSPVPKVPNVNLTKYVNLGENQWRFCPVVIAGNGRVKPDYVLAAGQPELHREGSYYIGTRTVPAIGVQLGKMRSKPMLNSKGIANCCAIRRLELKLLRKKKFSVA